MNITDERWREFVKLFAPKSDDEMARLYRAELRDRFAMAALTGLLGQGWTSESGREERAANAWAEADAMLKARDNA